MDAITHFHKCLDLNNKGPRDFKCFNFFFLPLYTLQLKNYTMLNNSEPVILTFNI